jgi:hypothetical protein
LYNWIDKGGIKKKKSITYATDIGGAPLQEHPHHYLGDRHGPSRFDRHGRVRAFEISQVPSQDASPVKKDSPDIKGQAVLLDELRDVSALEAERDVPEQGRELDRIKEKVRTGPIRESLP